MEIGNIVKGHLNEVLGLSKDLKEERLKICYMCPLYSSKFGGLCNNKLYLLLFNFFFFVFDIFFL